MYEALALCRDSDGPEQPAWLRGVLPSSRSHLLDVLAVLVVTALVLLT
jgi:hypothetical protein